jgi:hypothetical protein
MRSGILRSKSSCDRPGWMGTGGLCRSTHRGFLSGKGRTAAAAQAICSARKVQPECINYARADSETMGFWGGTSERERHHGAAA